MKKHLILVLSVLGIFTLTSTNCTKSEENLCEATEQELFERSFVISANIQYSDNVPYQGEVYFTIYKIYCSEKVSGEYSISHIKSDEIGNWYSGMKYSYFFANSQDKVRVVFHITNPNGTTYRAENNLWYADVEDESSVIMKTFYVKLPWQSPLN